MAGEVKMETVACYWLHKPHSTMAGEVKMETVACYWLHKPHSTMAGEVKMETENVDKTSDATTSDCSACSCMLITVCHEFEGILKYPMSACTEYSSNIRELQQ